MLVLALLNSLSQDQGKSVLVTVALALIYQPQNEGVLDRAIQVSSLSHQPTSASPAVTETLLFQLIHDFALAPAPI